MASFWGLFVSPFPIAWVSSVLIFPIIFCNVVVMFGGVVDPVWHKPKSGNINKTHVKSNDFCVFLISRSITSARLFLMFRSYVMYVWLLLGSCSRHFFENVRTHVC